MQRRQHHKSTQDPVAMRWIARAATPWERVACPAFEPCASQHPEIVADRRKAWVEAAAAGSDTEFEALLKRRGIDRARWLTGLQDFEVVDESGLPEWALDFCVLFERMTETAASAVPGKAPVQGGMFKPWMLLALEDIDNCIAAHRMDDLFTPQARRHLAEYLSKRFGMADWRVSAHGRLQWPNDDNDDPGAWMQAWRRCFERYPVLVRLYAVLYRDWLDGCCELIEHLARDRALLIESFFDGRDPGAVVEVKCGSGDPHNGGRSVALLNFEHARLVHKPKKLRLTAAFNRLLQRLAQAAPQELALQSPRFIDRGEYAWEAFAAPQPCAGPDEVALFYRRLGAWLRLLEVMNAADYWFDNLFAHGPAPVFIDHELVVQPRRFHHPGDLLNVFSTESADDGITTLLQIGILPLLLPLHDGRGVVDISCIAVPGWHRSPLQRRVGKNINRTDNANRMRLSGEGFVEWREDRYVPQFEDRYCDLSEHIEVFGEGYAGMAQFLSTSQARDAFAHFDAEARDAWLRFILIDTWSCYLWNDSFVAPTALGDGVRYEIGVERLWQVYPHHPVPVMESAIYDFRRCDVPLYRALASSCDLYGVGGQCARNYFREDALSFIRRRLQPMDDEELQRRRDLICSLFSTRPDHPRRPAPQSTAVRGKPVRDRLDAAVRIGGTIIAAAQEDDGDLFWHGIIRSPLSGARLFHRVSDDLDSGLAGIGIYFAHLHRVCGEQRFGDYAERLARQLCRVPEHPNMFYAYGAARGLGGRLAAIADIHDQLGSQMPADAMHGMLELGCRRERMNQLAATLPGYADGLFGLICMLGFVQARAPGAGFDDWAEKLSKHAGAVPEKFFEAAPGSDAGLTGAVVAPAPPPWFPGAHYARALARALWPQFAGNSGSDELAAASRGDIITGLMLETLPGAPATPPGLAKRALELAASAPQEQETTDCLERLWFALAASARDPAGARQAQAIGDELFDAFDRTGRWFPQEWGPDHHLLSAVDGLASVGFACLALHGAGSIFPPCLMGRQP